VKRLVPGGQTAAVNARVGWLVPSYLLVTTDYMWIALGPTFLLSYARGVGRGDDAHLLVLYTTSCRVW
jgi:hypothetical protein